MATVAEERALYALAKIIVVGKRHFQSSSETTACKGCAAYTDETLCFHLRDKAKKVTNDGGESGCFRRTWREVDGADA